VKNDSDWVLKTNLKLFDLSIEQVMCVGFGFVLNGQLLESCLQLYLLFSITALSSKLANSTLQYLNVEILEGIKKLI